MSDLRLRARSATEIVDAAFQLYRRDALEYILVSAVTYAPWLLAELLIIAPTGRVGALTASEGGLAFGIAILRGVAFSLLAAVLSRYASDAYLGHSPQLGAVVRASIPRLVSVIVAAVALGAATIIGFVPAGVGIALLIGPLAFAGFFFAIAWLLFVLSRYFAVFQVIVIEHAGVVEAFRRSSFLARGRTGHILLTLLLVAIAMVGLWFGLAIVGQLTGSLVAALTLQTVFLIVAYPMFAITQTILYYDARIRAEGFDIEVLTGALGGDAGAPAQEARP